MPSTWALSLPRKKVVISSALVEALVLLPENKPDRISTSLLLSPVDSLPVSLPVSTPDRKLKILDPVPVDVVFFSLPVNVPERISTYLSTSSLPVFSLLEPVRRSFTMLKNVSLSPFFSVLEPFSAPPIASMVLFHTPVAASEIDLVLITPPRNSANLLKPFVILFWTSSTLNSPSILKLVLRFSNVSVNSMPALSSMKLTAFFSPPVTVSSMSFTLKVPPPISADPPTSHGNELVMMLSLMDVPLVPSKASSAFFRTFFSSGFHTAAPIFRAFSVQFPSLSTKPVKLVSSIDSFIRTIAWS